MNIDDQIDSVSQELLNTDDSKKDTSSEQVKQRLMSLLETELSNSSEWDHLENSLNLYLGKPDGSEIEGRSQITSTDVADAIEWIMPQIMKSFTQNNEIVEFDPVHEGDEKQAELESQYVYEVLMKQNDGFIILHQFIKDALMQRFGVLKVYYAEEDKARFSSWTGINEEQLNILLSKDDIEILDLVEYVDDTLTMMKQQDIQMKMSQMPPEQMTDELIDKLQTELQTPVMSFNVDVKVSRKKGKIYIDPVPPEEFRINSRHNCISTKGARFTAHHTRMTIGDVISEFDISFSKAKELPTSTNWEDSDYRFEYNSASILYTESDDEALKEVNIYECFLRADIQETGVLNLYKITAAGEDDTVSEILSVEEVSDLPWVTTTAFIMSHKFEGLSITDRLEQIQGQKTQLWRNILDNVYLQNNQRHAVLEGQVNVDDLLVSRPGGIIRVKNMGAIQPLITPPLTQDVYNSIEYLDKVRAARTGVEADGPATPQNIGDRVGSEGVDRLMNAKEELVGLIIRVVAETGIKSLCCKIRDISMMHINAVMDFRFRGEWHKINPSEWFERTSTTVRVGTGTGNHMQKLGALREVLTIQEKLAASPAQTVLLDEQKTFNALDDFCKLSGLNGASRYFLDPSSSQGQQKSQQNSMAQQEANEVQKQMQAQLVEAQNKIAEAEQGKSIAQQQSAAAKARIDYMNTQIKGLENQINSITKDRELTLKENQMANDVALRLTELEVEAENKDLEREFKSNKGQVNGQRHRTTL